jgi:cholesterol transport system auxiliary component
VKNILVLLLIQLALTACSAVKIPVSNQYTLNAYSAKTLARHDAHLSILVSQPEALAGYQTEQMHYIQKPFELSTFANNSWISPPATMLYPLILQSLQKTRFFHAVASGPYADKADYRLDTQVMMLQQNFLIKPSAIDLVVKITLTHISDNRLVASRMISEHVPCPSDNPYGGVIAANEASKALTSTLSQFVISQIKQDDINK